MRTTIIKGINDDISIEVHGNIDLICAIMDVGKMIDQITYEATLKGEKLIEILIDCRFKDAPNWGIQKENDYEVTAYDW